MYFDTERNEYITLEQLEHEFHTELTEEDRAERTFHEYLSDCLNGNGFLKEVK